MLRLGAEASPPDNDNVFRIIGFLLDQLGGSIVLSPVEQDRVFTGDLRMIEVYRDDRGNFTMKVVTND